MLTELALNTGQLVKDEYFTLFESVAALEVRSKAQGEGSIAGLRRRNMAKSIL